VRQIIVKPRWEKSMPPHPDDVDYPTLYFQLEDSLALCTDGYCVHLIGVVPDEADPGTYRIDGSWYGHIPIGRDDERSIAGLLRIIEQLKAISGWDLLLQHYNQRNGTFFINRDRYYSDNTEDAEKLTPIDLQSYCDGQANY